MGLSHVVVDKGVAGLLVWPAETSVCVHSGVVRPNRRFIDDTKLVDVSHCKCLLKSLGLSAVSGCYAVRLPACAAEAEDENNAESRSLDLTHQVLVQQPLGRLLCPTLCGVEIVFELHL